MTGEDIVTKHTARGRLWIVTIHDHRVSIIRFEALRRGQRAPAGWSERHVPLSAIRCIDIDPPGYFSDGRLRLHLDPAGSEPDRVETVAFKRDEHEAMRRVAAALRAQITD